MFSKYLNNNDLLEIRLGLVGWYRKNSRDLPWRHSKNPYLIWISEIILQQTRVNQGLSYFNRFIARFPTVESLAEAEEDEVMKYWQGLGYYSRARNLHAASKLVLDKFSGNMPMDYESILSLKGVGEYTAAAICSFAYDLPYAVLDGNVFRFLSRLFGIETPINSPKAKKEFSALAQFLLDKDSPALYNQAIMEFGALQCVPNSPNCEQCPFLNRCFAYQQNQIKIFPIKEKKNKVKERFFNYFVVDFGGYTFIKKRSENDIWKNLYEFPLIETEKKVSLEMLLKTEEFSILFSGASLSDIQVLSESVKHVLTHRIIYASFYKIKIDSLQHHLFLNDFNKIQFPELSIYPVSRLIDSFLETKTNEIF